MKKLVPTGWPRARARLLVVALSVAGGCVLLPRPTPSIVQPLPPLERPVPVAPVVPAPLPVRDLAAGPPPPAIDREFRGVWVASVGNMDWPSRPGLSTERQQAELIAILDRAKGMGLNAVLFQVRPGADALYASPLEPWSEYLTGTMGRAPDPFYDPLEFAVREAHRRGLELHAWFNPFRARHPSGRTAAAATHVSRARPELVRRYGSQLWMDPAEPAVHDISMAVILDVVRRYDVDGVHLDDYFYPYREYDRAGRLIQFPDQAAYERYRRGGGEMGRSDWRRENVNRFVERLYREVKREDPAVKVGISPFGIWRPGHPAQVTGLDAYEEIFADARKWLVNGWVDYFTPQLYWPINQYAQSFPVLLEWWAQQNRFDRHLWPGGYTDRVRIGRSPWPATEILAQIEATRANPGSTGYVHFNMSALMANPSGVSDLLARDSYARPALVPASPWLDSIAPAPPRVTLDQAAPGPPVLRLAPEGPREVFLWTVRTRSGPAWITRVLPAAVREVALEGVPEQVVVTAVGRTGNESAPARIPVPAGPGAPGLLGTEIVSGD